MLQESIPQFRTVAAGEVIYAEGYAGNACIYVIAEGKVEITTRRDETGTAVLAVLGKDEYFGESALLAAEPRGSAARALSFCRLIVIDPKTIDDELDRVSPLLRHLMRSLIHKSKRAVDRVPADVHADSLSRVVSYANVLSLMAEAGRHDVHRDEDVFIALVSVFERCQAISGHPRMQVMATLRRMETLGLIGIGTVGDFAQGETAVSIDEPVGRQAVVFNALRIIESAQRCVDRGLGIPVAREVEQAGLTSLDALVGIEKQLLLDKLYRGASATFSGFREPAQSVEQLETLSDMLFIDDRTLFDTVSVFDSSDLAKMLVSAKHRTVSDRLLSVMTRAKQLEVSRIIQRDVVIDAIEIAEIERSFIRLLKSIKSGATVPPARSST